MMYPPLTYMDTYFKVAYMLRSIDDKMDFYRLCTAFKADTSKIVDNNKVTPPEEIFNKGNGELIATETKLIVKDLLATDIKSYKSLKKDLLVERLDSTQEKLNRLSCFLLKKMNTMHVQYAKKTGEIV